MTNKSTENPHQSFNRLLATHDIGSIRKLNSTVLALQGRDITEHAIEETKEWWERLNLGDSENFIKLILNRPFDTDKVLEWSEKVLEGRLRFNIRFLEQTGLDFVYTGESWRKEMYHHFASQINGIFLEDTYIRSFDDRFYQPGVQIMGEEVKRPHPICIDEFKAAYQFTTKPLRLCLTGPYTVYDWTIKETNQEDFFIDLIDNVYVQELKDCIEAGARMISLDEPAYTTKPYEQELFIEGYRRLFKAIESQQREKNVKIGFHTCYSDHYDILFEDLPLLPWDFCSVEAANRDKTRFNENSNDMKVYRDMVKLYTQALEGGSNAKITIGVLEVHSPFFLSITNISKVDMWNLLRKLIYKRIKTQVNLIQDSIGEEGVRKLFIGPDCGLRGISNWNDLFWMLRTMVLAANEVREELISKGYSEYYE